jgi:hypothetical protein
LVCDAVRLEGLYIMVSGFAGTFAACRSTNIYNRCGRGPGD